MKLALVEPNNSKFRKIITLLIALGLVMFAGIRGPNVDADYDVYTDRFNTISRMSLKEIIDVVGFLSMEPGFVFLNASISTLGLGAEALFFVVAALAVTVKSIFIYRYSPYIGLSFTLYFVHIYLHTEMIQIRGGLAVSILLFSVKYLASRNFLKFLVVIMGAMSIHKMSILALPMYFLYSPSFFNNYKYICFGLLACFASIIFPPLELLKTILAGSIPMFDLYYSWDRFNYSLGYFNPTFIKGLFTFILLYMVRDRLFERYGDFYKGAIFILFIAMVWLFVFRDFAILAARGAAFINTTDFIIAPAVIYAFKSKTPIFFAILCLAYIMLYLNIYVKGVVSPYESIF